MPCVPARRARDSFPATRCWPPWRSSASSRWARPRSRPPSPIGAVHAGIDRPQGHADQQARRLSRHDAERRPPRPGRSDPRGGMGAAPDSLGRAEARRGGPQGQRQLRRGRELADPRDEPSPVDRRSQGGGRAVQSRTLRGERRQADLRLGDRRGLQSHRQSQCLRLPRSARPREARRLVGGGAGDVRAREPPVRDRSRLHAEPAAAHRQPVDAHTSRRLRGRARAARAAAERRRLHAVRRPPPRDPRSAGTSASATTTASTRRPSIARAPSISAAPACRLSLPSSRASTSPASISRPPSRSSRSTARACSGSSPRTAGTAGSSGSAGRRTRGTSGTAGSTR